MHHVLSSGQTSLWCCHFVSILHGTRSFLLSSSQQDALSHPRLCFGDISELSSEVRHSFFFLSTKPHRIFINISSWDLPKVAMEISSLEYICKPHHLTLSWHDRDVKLSEGFYISSARPKTNICQVITNALSGHKSSEICYEIAGMMERTIC